MASLVSILIPCYNASLWVARAIESALMQTWSNKEVIVVDDGSTDDSLAVIRRYEGEVQIVTQPNSGQNATRNRLTQLSRGEWLVFLDADDELMPDSVELKMKHAGKADVIYGSMETITFEGQKPVFFEKRVAVDYEDPISAALWWAYPNTTAMAFKRQALLKAGGWDESVKNCTDYALYFPLLADGCRFRAAPDSWSVYRMWSPAQAVREAPIRRITTRLQVTRAAAKRFRQAGMWTQNHEQGLLDASLGSMRLLYLVDPALAVEEHARMRSEHPNYLPARSVFSWEYLLFYHLVGFAVTEWVAARMRKMMPSAYTRRKAPCFAELRPAQEDRKSVV